MYYKDGAVVNKENRFPRSVSMPVIGPAGASASGSSTMSAADAATAPAEMDVKEDEFDDDDDWGDGDDDLFCQIACEVESLERRGQQSANKIPVGGTTTPAENLSLRRQQLVDEEVGRGVDHRGGFVLTPGTEELVKERERVGELTAEIEKKRQEILKLKGEATILRRENENLKKESVDQFNTTMSQQITRDRGRDDELNKLKNENAELKAAVLKKTITANTKSTTTAAPRPALSTQKHPSHQNWLNVSVSAQSQSQMTQPPEWTQKFKSPKKGETQDQAPQRTVPPLPLQTTETQPPDWIHRFQQAPQDTKKVEQKNVRIQTDEEVSSTSKSSEPQFDPPLDWTCTTKTMRAKIFSNLDEVVELSHEIVSPILEKVSEAADKLILRSMFGGKVVRVRSAFPDIFDTMFQWGIDKKREKELKDAGIESPKPPILPSTFPKGYHRYSDMKVGIEASYKYFGVWGALVEVRELLEKLLRSLQDENRFRLYELNTLTCFWKLLCWGNELWKCILSEEENVGLIEQRKGKGEWDKELERWTGIVLKSDWRDFVSRDLEVEIRKLTLEILESIVLAGYFERNSRRYDILCRILSDVLTRRIFHESCKLQRVIKILHWSLSDLFIFKYLCTNNKKDNPCLAKILGESILKYIRDKQKNKDPVGTCLVFLDYLFFLEALSFDKIPRRFESKHAKEVRDLEEQSRKQEEEEMQTRNISVPMEVDRRELAASQFACPVKYQSVKRNSIVSVRDLQEAAFSAWINPQNYVNVDYDEEETCPCRKTLVGSALIAFPIIFEEWKKRYEQWGELTEKLEGSELLELKNLEEEMASKGNLSPPSQARLEYLQKKHTDIRTVWEKAEKVKGLISVYAGWGWNDIIKHDRIVMGDELDEDGEPLALPSCVYDMARSPDIFDLAINKTVVLMNFLDVKCTLEDDLDINVVAATGSEAYKAKLTIYPMLRFYINEISFTRNMRDLVLRMTNDGQEEEGHSDCTSLFPKTGGQASSTSTNAPGPSTSTNTPGPSTSTKTPHPLDHNLLESLVEPLPLTDLEDDPDFQWLKDDAKKSLSSLRKENNPQSRNFSKIESREAKMSEAKRIQSLIRSGACSSEDLEEMIEEEEAMDVDDSESVK